MVKNTYQNDKHVSETYTIQFGWYILRLAVNNAHVGHTRYMYWLFLHFMKLNLLPTCLPCYLPELFLEVDFIC